MRELGPELLHQHEILLDRQHLPAACGQSLGDDAAARTDLDDQIICTDAGAIEEMVDEPRTAQEIL